MDPFALGVEANGSPGPAQPPPSPPASSPPFSLAHGAGTLLEQSKLMPPCLGDSARVPWPRTSCFRWSCAPSLLSFRFLLKLPSEAFLTTPQIPPCSCPAPISFLCSTSLQSTSKYRSVSLFIYSTPPEQKRHQARGSCQLFSLLEIPRAWSICRIPKSSVSE